MVFYSSFNALSRRLSGRAQPNEPGGDGEVKGRRRESAPTALPSTGEAWGECRRIYDLHVPEGAEEEVNVSSSQKREAKIHMATLSDALADAPAGTPRTSYSTASPHR